MAIRVVTVFDQEELEEMIGELRECCLQVGDHLGRVYDAFILSSNLYLVTEYFENGSLRDLVLLV